MTIYVRHNAYCNRVPGHDWLSLELEFCGAVRAYHKPDLWCPWCGTLEITMGEPLECGCPREMAVARREDGAIVGEQCEMCDTKEIPF